DTTEKPLASQLRQSHDKKIRDTQGHLGITEHILSFDFLISVIISSAFSLAPNHTSVFKQNKSL
uniref:Uncharacterized protein n=1 Tax=Amphiprion percula TaxID=161767 RepID=A0A3P8TYS6_AMPPE